VLTRLSGWGFCTQNTTERYPIPHLRVCLATDRPSSEAGESAHLGASCWSAWPVPSGHLARDATLAPTGQTAPFNQVEVWGPHQSKHPCESSSLPGRRQMRSAAAPQLSFGMGIISSLSSRENCPSLIQSMASLQNQPAPLRCSSRRWGLKLV